MAHPQKRVPFDEFETHLASIFDEIVAHDGSVEVERDGRIFAIKPKPRRKGKPNQGFSPSDPFFAVAGIGRSTGPGDVSANKHKYLADAVADLHPISDGAMTQTNGSPDTPRRGFIDTQRQRGVS